MEPHRKPNPVCSRTRGRAFVHGALLRWAAILLCLLSTSAHALPGSVSRWDDGVGYHGTRSENGIDYCAKSGYATSPFEGLTQAFVPDGTGFVGTAGAGIPHVFCRGTYTETYPGTSRPPNAYARTFDFNFFCPLSGTGVAAGGRPLPPKLRYFFPEISMRGATIPVHESAVRQYSPNEYFSCGCTGNTVWSEKYKFCLLEQPATVIGFFNGVWNTRKDANNGLDALHLAVGDTHGDVPIKYELFYNETGCGGPEATCLQDIAETFAQRGSEINGVLGDRWEHFWEVLAGTDSNSASWTGDLLGRLGAGATALAPLVDSAFEAALGEIVALTARMFSNPPTGTDVAAQIAKLQALADDGSDFVLVAHSQGNLFVNAAYDALRSGRPDAKVKVVHVAPASPTVRGEHVLADIDLVINGLRIQGITSVQPVNINLPLSKADASGHILIGTYLDATRAGRGRLKSMLQAALDALSSTRERS